MDILARIKRALIEGHCKFSRKALDEMEAEDLSERDVIESILSAVAIHKTIRSRSPLRVRSGERLYVIISTNLSGLPLYTKGKLIREAGHGVFYVLISSKKAQ
jgi:hypothetical protein